MAWSTAWFCSLFAAVGPAAASPELPSGSVMHGPFEIVASVRRISSGAFPNTSGNPFSRVAKTEFRLRWRGKAVEAPGGQDRFWHVLRLTAAPRPAVLLVTTGFVLAFEDAAGALQFTPLDSKSSGLAELQWLDATDGQPGPSRNFGFEALADLQAATLLAGGRWLRLGSQVVIDVNTLSVSRVEPWVPMVPGVPITSISRQGDEVRAFSPGRTHYVLAASGPDYSRVDRPTAYGLLVVDIASGTASELRMDRKRFRFAEQRDIDAAWIAHHFIWQRDAAGREQLVPRDHFAPWPWKSRLWRPDASRWQLDVRRMDAAFLPVLRRLLEAEPGVQMSAADNAATASTSDKRLAFSMDGCMLRATAFGAGSTESDRHHIAIGMSTEAGAGSATGTTAACEAAVRRLAARIDRELATGRHDALLKLD